MTLRVCSYFLDDVLDWNLQQCHLSRQSRDIVDDANVVKYVDSSAGL